MATSLTTDANGVRVLTPIIPLVGSEAVQCPSEKKEYKTKVPEVPYMTRMFLKGEPVALGVRIAIPTTEIIPFILSHKITPDSFFIHKS